MPATIAFANSVSTSSGLAGEGAVDDRIEFQLGGVRRPRPSRRRASPRARHGHRARASSIRCARPGGRRRATTSAPRARPARCASSRPSIRRRSVLPDRARRRDSSRSPTAVLARSQALRSGDSRRSSPASITMRQSFDGISAQRIDAAGKTARAGAHPDRAASAEQRHRHRLLDQPRRLGGKLVAVHPHQRKRIVMDRRPRRPAARRRARAPGRHRDRRAG